MAQVTPIQTNFTGGEISPRLLGRVDLTKYSSSVQTCENFIVFPHGGVTKRPGTKFIAEVKNSAQKSILVQFIFSTVQAYVIEFGHQYVRFYRDAGQIQNNNAPYEVASPYDEDDLAGLKFTQSADILYICHPSYKTRKLSRTGHTAWSFSTFDALDGPYLAQNTTSTTLDPNGTSGSVTITASATTGINNDTGFQSTDVGRSIRIRFSSAPKWGWVIITGVTNTTTVTATIQSSPLGNFSAHPPTAAWRLGAWSDTTGWPTAASFYQQRLFFANTTTEPNTIWSSMSGDFETFSPTNQDGEVNDDAALNLTLATDQVNAVRWLFGAKQLLCGTSDGPFIISSGSDNLALKPTNVTVNRETTDGVANKKPIGASRAAIFIDRTRTKIRELAYNLEVDGFSTPDLTLIAEHITTGNVKELAYTRSPDNLIWALLDTGELRCLTYEREQDVVAWHRHVIGGISGTATITVGSGYLDIPVGSSIILTKSDGNTVTFVSEAPGPSAPSATNGWRPSTSTDVTADNIYTAINAHADFTVANPAANVVTIKETSRSGEGFLSIKSTTDILTTTSQSHAKIHSVAAVPSADELEEQLYMIVERTINGATKKYVEYLTKPFDTAKGDTNTDAFFVDSGLSYSGAAVTSLSGLGHLEGETVKILINGSLHADKVVSSGAISLDAAATSVHVGLKYRGLLRTLDPEVQTETGPSQGKTRRVERVTARLVDTYNLKVGNTLSNLQDVYFLAPNQAMGEIALYTGDKRLVLNFTAERQFDLYFVHEDPLPCTILAVMYGMIISER